MRGDGGVAGEGRVVGVPKFYKCTMPSTQIGCPTLPLACVLYCIIYLYYVGPLSCILGLHVIYTTVTRASGA